MLSTLPSRSRPSASRPLRWLDEVGAVVILVAALALIAVAGYETQAVANPAVAALATFAG